MKRYRNWLKFSLIFLLLVVLVELFARFYLGLGHLPVYVTDADYEYIYAPNQEVYRYGNRIKTNSLSMRSEELSEKDDIRIIKFGDSVINGGAHVDQDSLASTLLEKWLSESTHKNVRVLNVSAQSWGPDNAFAYLKKQGDFGSKTFVLVLSSHDFHDNMHHRAVVGVHPTWPNQQPLCAFTDGFSRYFWPGVKSFFGLKEDEYAYLKGFDDSPQNQGLKQFVDYSRQNNISLVVYLHAEKSELENGTYNRNGIEIIDFFANEGIRVYQGIGILTEKDFYRDNIHLNEKGHRRLAQILYPILAIDIGVGLEH